MKFSNSAPALRSVPLVGQGVLRLRTDQGVIAVTCLWKRSSRARHLRLTIDRLNHVVLTLPPRYPVDKGLQFVRTKTDWLVRHLASRPPPVTLHRFLADKKTLSALGRRIPMAWRMTSGDAAMVWKAVSGQVVFSFDVNRHGEEELVFLLRNWAAKMLVRRTAAFAAHHDLRVKRVTVRDQVSRWGSCSAKGTISLNWRLILLPPVIQDYVILHELAHLKVLNHSDRFWNFLQGLDPLALEHDAELSRLTPVVMGLGRLGPVV